MKSSKFSRGGVEHADGDEDVITIEGPKTTFVRTIPVKQHSFYLYDEIGEPADYAEMIHTIRTAAPHDQISIYLNTPGGNLATGIAIVSAMSETEATVTTVLDSTACSMGAILFLAGHQYIVHDCTIMMFHTFSGGVYGKSSDIDRQVQAYKRQYSSLVKRVCSKFLSADEIRRIDNGEDMWFTAEVISRRLRELSKKQSEPTVKEISISSPAVGEPEAPLKPTKKPSQRAAAK